MGTKTKRQQMRERHQRRKMTSTVVWIVIGIFVLAVIGFTVWQGVRASVGEAVPVMANSSQHIEVDSDPGEYNSDPPTSGPHYAEEPQAGFYDTDRYTYAAGYLVHNLEHGYVIFWYNCDLLDDAACADLKVQIRSLMDELGGTKLIAYPWPSLDVPVALTSWGQIQEFETFDADQAKTFVRTNLNRAPESNAP